jgi:DNA modification methylase
VDRPNVGTASIIRGNALDLPIADGSVDLIVTSPPYFGLRSYQDGGEHYEGQIGDEATPAEFVDALVAATAEMVRVLKPSGSIWVNLGDKYAGVNIGTSSGHRGGTIGASGYDRHVGQGRQTSDDGIRQKSLIGVPWRYALRCIDELGLILRAEVIWSKPNGLPESVTDRVRRSHETWFHFTKSPRYFSAVDEIREPSTDTNGSRARAIAAAETRILETGEGWGELGAARASKVYDARPNEAKHAGVPGVGTTFLSSNPLGKLPGSVWTIPTQPLRVPDHLGIDHFAAFPMEWPRRIILGWSPAGVCVYCGEGRRPVATADRDHVDYDLSERRALERVSASGAVDGGTKRSTLGHETTRTITGYACACPEPAADTRPAIVLDPFGGTGTTALVAKALGRHGISNDMSSDYCRLATWRTNDEGELARAMQVEKPAEQVKGQASLLDLIDGGAA